MATTSHYQLGHRSTSVQYPPRSDRIFIFPPSCAPHQVFINVHFLGRRRRIMKDGRGAVAEAAGENGWMDDKIWSIGTASSISWHHSSADQRFMTSNSSTTSNLITHFCTFPPVSCLNYNFMPSKEASFLPSEYFFGQGKGHNTRNCDEGQDGYSSSGWPENQRKIGATGHEMWGWQKTYINQHQALIDKNKIT